MQEGWVYVDPASGLPVYRAYSLGNCLRSLVAARLGEDVFPPHQRFRAAMDASGGLEEEVLRRFSIEMASSEIIWKQKMVEMQMDVVWGEDITVNVTPVIIRGHLDAMYQLDDSILEVKVFGDNYWDRWKSGGYDALPNQLGEKYKVQQAVYGFATQRKVRFVVGHKGKLATPHGDGSFDWVIDEVDIGPPVDPSELKSLDWIQNRIATIEDFAARDELPDCTHNCRESDPYGESHLFAGPEQGDDRLEQLVRRRDELKDILGEEPDEKKKRPGSGLLGELALIQDEIKTDYGHPTEKRAYTVGPFTVTIVANKGREYLDRGWLKRNHPDVEASAVRLSKPFSTLIVKRVKGDKGEE